MDACILLHSMYAALAMPTGVEILETWNLDCK